VTADSARVRDRWHGWAWLAVAIITPAFFLGTHAALLTRAQQFLVALAFGTIGLVLWIVEARRGEVGQETTRIDRPLTLVYIRRRRHRRRVGPDRSTRLVRRGFPAPLDVVRRRAWRILR